MKTYTKTLRAAAHTASPAKFIRRPMNGLLIAVRYISLGSWLPRSACTYVLKQCSAAQQQKQHFINMLKSTVYCNHIGRPLCHWLTAQQPHTCAHIHPGAHPYPHIWFVNRTFQCFLARASSHINTRYAAQHFYRFICMLLCATSPASAAARLHRLCRL